MSELLSIFLSGTVFGLVAGISPGPLLTLVISESLKHGKMAGIKASLAPLVTDLPIIIVTVFIFSKLSNFNSILALVSFAGAAVLFYLGYECLVTKGVESNSELQQPKSLSRGIVINALSPHPYLFWLTIGAPTLNRSWAIGPDASMMFVLPFYFLLVGSKVLIAVLADKSRSFLKDKIYLLIMKFLGLTLVLFAALFIKDALIHSGLF